MDFLSALLVAISAVDWFDPDAVRIVQNSTPNGTEDASALVAAGLPTVAANWTTANPLYDLEKTGPALPPYVRKFNLVYGVLVTQERRVNQWAARAEAAGLNAEAAASCARLLRENEQGAADGDGGLLESDEGDASELVSPSFSCIFPRSPEEALGVDDAAVVRDIFASGATDVLIGSSSSGDDANSGNDASELNGAFSFTLNVAGSSLEQNLEVLKVAKRAAFVDHATTSVTAYLPIFNVLENTLTVVSLRWTLGLGGTVVPSLTVRGTRARSSQVGTIFLLVPVFFLLIITSMKEFWELQRLVVSEMRLAEARRTLLLSDEAAEAEYGREGGAE